LEAGLRVAEESTMAEINKLSVEKALNKLRSNDVQKTTKSDSGKASAKTSRGAIEGG
jgi:hypothetical protein